MTDPQHAAAQHSDSTVHDFDAFWAQYGTNQAPERVRIRGVVVEVPVDIPMSVQMRDIGEPGAFDATAVREVVESMYGQDTFQTWLAAGMGLNELGVVVAWTNMRVQGEKVSFAEAAERITTMAAEQAQLQSDRAKANAKLSAAAGDSAQARADRAAAEALVDAGKAPSFGSGEPSKPTFAGSTAFDPPRSPPWGPGSSSYY